MLFSGPVFAIVVVDLRIILDPPATLVQFVIGIELYLISNHLRLLPVKDVFQRVIEDDKMGDFLRDIAVNYVVFGFQNVDWSL